MLSSDTIGQQKDCVSMALKSQSTFVAWVLNHLVYCAVDLLDYKREDARLDLD